MAALEQDAEELRQAKHRLAVRLAEAEAGLATAKRQAHTAHADWKRQGVMAKHERGGEKGAAKAEVNTQDGSQAEDTATSQLAKRH